MTSKPLLLADDRQRRMLRCAIEVAQTLGIPKEELLLVGEAVLQARWRHRETHSLSLLFEDSMTSGKAGLRIDANIQAIKGRRDVKAIAQEGQLHLRWTTDDGDIGIYPTPILYPRSHAQTERSTGIHVQSAASALGHIAHSKMGKLAQFHFRDAVDILTARRMDPESLREHSSWIDGSRERYALDEIIWQNELAPEGERKIRSAAVAVLEAVHAGESLPMHADLTIPEPPPVPLRHIDPLDVRLLPLERFDHPLFHVRKPLATQGSDLMRIKNMAGHRLSPTLEDIQSWLLEEDPKDLPQGARSYMHEYLEQIVGDDFSAFRQECGASLHDIARMAHQVDGISSPAIKYMLNSYAHLAAQDPFEIVDSEAWLLLR